MELREEAPVATLRQEASTAARERIKSSEIALKIKRALKIEGEIWIKQIRGGQIQFSIAPQDAEKLLEYFKQVPFYDQGLHLKNRFDKHGYTKIVVESFFRLRLLAHLFLNGDEKKDTIRVADLIDKMTGVRAEYGQIDHLRPLLKDFRWDPKLFMLLNEEALFCSHVRKLAQAHTVVYLDEHAADFRPEKSKRHDIGDTITTRGDELPFVIEVVPEDCLVAASKLVAQRPSVCVLNMANQFTPGGGYAHGAGAQEEDLCRRTDLVKSLPPKYRDQSTGFGEFAVLYSSKVTVFRTGQVAGYGICDPKERFQVNVVSSAAYNNSKVESRTYKDPSTPEYEAGMKRKIRGQLRAADHYGDRCLVLSAFGCGAFQNDSTRVAQFYLEVLSEKEFVGVFDIVQFAIIPNPSQTNNDNYTNFQKVFAGKGLKREDLKVATLGM
jgi:uncharacterized protein (TIGR02452 family)